MTRPRPSPTTRPPRKPRGRRLLLRRAAWSALLVVGLLLATMLGFYAYAESQQDLSHREAAPRGGRFVQAADVEMHLIEKGPADGPVVVMVHGTGAWGGLWGETSDALAAAGYRAVALDLPPFGFSQRPEGPAYAPPDQARRILGALDALGVARATMLAHSFGSRAAMEAVLMQPERFDRVILVDAALDLDATDAEENKLLKAVLGVRPLRDPLVASTLVNPLLTKTFFKALMHNGSAATPERVALLQQPFVVEGLTRDGGLWLQVFLAPERPSLSNDATAYARLPMPVLLVWGEKDDTTPLARGERLRDAIPGARLVVMPGVGHVPHVEEPERFQRVALDFLDSR